MFWQSGAVNYVYSSNWILLFLIVYLRKVKNPDAKELKWTTVWMLPLGFITGWSNEIWSRHGDIIVRQGLMWLFTLLMYLRGSTRMINMVVYYVTKVV